MDTRTRHIGGFTLIELMVTVAVVVTLMVVAFPSFTAFRHRAAVRAAADGVVSVWNDARFEAAKRNSNVKFGFVSDATGFCVGAATTADPNDTTPCDCMSEAPALNVCDVARFPGSQSEWNGVSLNAGSTLGAGDDVVVLDLKQLRLVTAAGAGAISMDDPAGSKNYRLNVRIDRFGRAVVCQSTANGLDNIPEYNFRRCAP